MMVAERSGGAHSIGWLTSLCLHATLAFGALAVTQRVTLAPQPIPFTWNVAMVTAPSGPLQSSATPATTIHPPVNQPPPPARSASIAPAPAPDADSMKAMTAEPTMPRAAEPMDRKNQAPQILDSPPPVQSTEQERAFEQVLAPAPAQAPTSTSQLSSQEPESVSDSSSTMQPLPREQEASLSAQTPGPVASSTARADYAWLSETIMRRMQELKRYPMEARLERAEGKVVLKVVLRSNGSLEAVEIFQSSGHQSLDRAAVELLNLAAPFHFPRPLEKPQMTVKIPMSYRLER
jgi:periplasmic protein TonB